MSVSRHALTKSTAHPKARSRISNGGDILGNIDGRTANARRYRDICGAVIADLGGMARCSEIRLALIRRFAAASVMAEALEARLAMGEQVNPEAFSAISSTSVRLAQRIGLDKIMKDVTPSLDSYIAQITTPNDEDDADQSLTDEQLLEATTPREAAE